MCGRYALALRPSQVRQYLQDEDMQVDEAPDDDADGGPRQSYNFAPGYHGIVYRADVPDYGAGPRQHKGDSNVEEEEEEAATEQEQDAGEVKYKLQSMKWGLIPFWTKRNPDYGSMMKTINCRDDSLIENKGMWNTMKQRKRCIIVAQGFYEWLKKGPKEKVPYYTKRKDGQLMCFAGLWDCVQYESSDEKLYTYTIVTTDSNAQLNFLHDRMPVILENGSEDIKTWLDPKRYTWSKDLQALLKPSNTELECYPVSKEVGKVGNNSPNFIIPVASSENKSNIANFFAKGAGAKCDSSSKTTSAAAKVKAESPKKEGEVEDKKIKHEEGEDRKTIDHDGSEDHAPLPVPKEETKQGIKRELVDVPELEEKPSKMARTSASPEKPSSSPPKKPARKTRSATSNNTESPAKTTGKEKGSQKITSFFGK